MKSADEHIATFGTIPKGAPKAMPEDDLDTLVSLSTGTDLPVVIEADGKMVGVVTKDTLLQGLQGGEQS